MTKQLVGLHYTSNALHQPLLNPCAVFLLHYANGDYNCPLVTNPAVKHYFYGCYGSLNNVRWGFV